jgi:hypothetical protein
VLSGQYPLQEFGVLLAGDAGCLADEEALQAGHALDQAEAEIAGDAYGRDVVGKQPVQDVVTPMRNVSKRRQD